MKFIPSSITSPRLTHPREPPPGRRGRGEGRGNFASYYANILLRNRESNAPAAYSAGRAKARNTRRATTAMLETGRRVFESCFRATSCELNILIVLIRNIKATEKGRGEGDLSFKPRRARRPSVLGALRYSGNRRS